MTDIHESAITVYWRPMCIDCKRSKALLERRGIKYLAVNILTDSAARQAMVRINGGMESVPTIVFPDHSVLVEPSDEALAAKLMELGFLSEAASDMSDLSH